jgi:hypothetical protein
LFGGVAAAAVALALFPLSAAGASGAVTIHGSEFFTQKGGVAIFLATGSRFGAGTVGTFTSKYKTIGDPTKGPYKVKGTDSFTAQTGGTLTWSFASDCASSSRTKTVCKGTWTVTDGTGPYKGATGKGTLLGILNFDAAFNVTGQDTFTGTIA